MIPQSPHAMLPVTNHDEAARQLFTTALRHEVTVNMFAGNRQVFERRVEPAFEKEQGRKPKNRHEVRRALERDPYIQYSSALRLLYQEILWDSVGDSIDRQLPQLVDRSKKIARGKTKGSLKLDPSVTVPRYLNAVDIHMMPGNYDREWMEDDVFAGAIYDRGVYLRSIGNRGTYGEDYGTSFAAHVRQAWPGLKVRRVLEMGCAAGGSAVGLAQGFPGAEVHGIDVAAPMLRYAHARAESLGVPVHFSQQNAEATNFPDGHFDAIFGFALLHETSSTALPKILKEVHRLLSPGGVALFREQLAYSRVSLFQAAETDWDTYNNAEPFYGRLFDMDRSKIFVDAGFKAENVLDVPVMSVAHQRGNPRAPKSFGGFGARKEGGR